MTATLDGPTRTVNTVVTLSVGGDTVTVPDDLAAVDDFALTIVAGERGGAAVFTLYPVADDIDEEDETLTVTGTTNSGLTIKPPRLTVTIADDDERGVIVEPRVLSFPEGERRTYIVVLTSEPTDAVVVSTDVRGDRDVTTGAVSLTFPLTFSLRPG